ncbi:metal ABC transporter substrate-binding protein [Xanthobacter sp. TB0139]|uniref:metal ABC transporter substrate-binding protein n=1 Tax=Xanthobacter sp. TB0139 TaxID=3459178 RepID=UPI004039F15B
MISRRFVLAATLAAFVAPAFARPALADDGKLPVVASFSILGDFVKEVGGARVDVTTIVGPNGDSHVYQPTPADAKKLSAAKLIFVNGLGFEGWMERLAKASGTKAPIIVATTGISPRKGGEDEHEHDGHEHDDHEAHDKDHGHDAKAGKHDEHDHDDDHKHEGHHHGGLDPHAWQSVANARIYVANIRDALIAADPDGKAIYTANAAAYDARLDALNTEVKQAIGNIPAERRRIITSHGAFGYFADAYGVAFISPEGVSTESEASAKDVARIIRQIREDKIPAVFIENVSDPRLMERVAKETGAKVGGALYSDALSDDKGPASTYIELIRFNTKALTNALAQ